MTKEDGGFKDSTVKVVEGVRLPVKEAWRVQESHQGLSRALMSRKDPYNREGGGGMLQSPWSLIRHQSQQGNSIRPKLDSFLIRADLQLALS